MMLIQADCVKTMREFFAESIDLTVTSPPYDNLRTYKGNNELWNEQVWKDCIQELYRITKTGGVVVWIVSDATIKGSETGTSFKQALWAKQCGFNLHDTMIWRKTNPLPLNDNRYEPAFEYMFVWSKGKPITYNPIKIKSKRAGEKSSGSQINPDGTRRKKSGYGRAIKTVKVLTNVWDTAVGKGKGIHPAVFPYQLAHDHIISWSNENDVVLDPFMGSGTAGIACIKLNRRFIGIEIESEYFEIAKKRIMETT